MDYQKMFQSTPHSNGFPLMNYFPPQFQQQLFAQQLQQQQAMMNNPFMPMSKPHQNFMGGHQQQKGHFQLPPSAFCFPPSLYPSTSMMPSMSPLSLSTTESCTKEETPREIFFKTLSSSLKEANKFYSGKTTTWKNPFLYKTHLCKNFCNRLYCRFGVNCWYAHGAHELRCIPESDELPDAGLITQYLSFLGLPSQILDQIIQHAYCVANLHASVESTLKKSSTDLPPIGSASSSNSPINTSPSSTTPSDPIVMDGFSQLTIIDLI
jgi:hypothetical protein